MLFRRNRKSVASRSLSRPALPAMLEGLEPRMLMANDIAAAVVGHNLVITGDDVSNSIVITQVNQDFVVTGQNGTTIGGVDAPKTLSGVTGDFIIKMGAGNDSVTLTNVNVPRDLVYDGGTNTDALTVTGGSIGRNLIASNEGSLSSVSLTGPKIKGYGKVAQSGGGALQLASVNMGGYLAVSGGAGSPNSVSIADSGIVGYLSVGYLNSISNSTVTDISRSFVGGATTVISADSNLTESLTVTDSTLSGGLKVQDGNAGAYLTLQGSTRVGGNVSFTNLAGMGSFQSTGAFIAGSVTINNGNGASTTTFSGGSCGAVSVTNGTGADTLSAGSLAMAALTVVNGDGGSATTISSVTVAGSLSVLSGASSDTVTMTGVAVGGAMTLSGGAGGGTTTLTNVSVMGTLNDTGGADADTLTVSTLHVKGKTTVNLGDGANILNIDDSSFVGAASIQTGAGADTVNIDKAGSATGPATFFQGAFSLLLGGGNDTTILGQIAQTGQRVVFLGSVVIDGQDGTNTLTQNNVTYLGAKSLLHFS